MNRMVVQQLLALKSKAARGEGWQPIDFEFVTERLKEDDSARILAACCIISSGQSPHFPDVAQIIQNAVRVTDLPPYIVLSICEALVFLEAKDYLSFSEDIVAFVSLTIKQRAINLDNALCVLGKLGMAGERRASELLKSLACDADLEIRQTAAQVIAANATSDRDSLPQGPPRGD
jgi:hypothetical protein